MGLLEAVQGRKVYFDANIFIYFLEGAAPYQALLGSLFEALAAQRFTAQTSLLTVTEILPPLVRANHSAAIAGAIDLVRDSGLIETHSASDQIFIQAGFLRGAIGMKTPDALHVATAISQGADIFLTNDQGIRTPSSLTRLLLSDYV